MRAKDVMTTEVVSVRPETTVREIAQLLHDRRISAVPVVDSKEHLVGIVSEGDLIRRSETGTDRPASWWLALLANPEETALAYIKTHGGQAQDVMTRDVVTIKDDVTLEDITETLIDNRIKRVPVLRDGRLVGIVSRADLLHGLIARQQSPAVSADDRNIRAAVKKEFSNAGLRTEFLSVIVSGGIVHLTGAVYSEAEKQAARIAAESVAGSGKVQERIGVLPPSIRATMWAE